MKIIPKSLAVFWALPGKPAVQFHADFFPFPHETVADAVARYRRLFPADVIRSVRDQSGRFLPFKAA